MILDLRVVLALALAPLAAPVLLIVIYLVWFTALTGAVPSLQPIQLVAIGTALLSYIGLLVPGLPLLAYLSRRRRLKQLDVTLVGAGSGAVLMAVLSLWIASRLQSGSVAMEMVDWVQLIVYGAAMGVAVVSSFAWMVGMNRLGDTFVGGSARRQN